MSYVLTKSAEADLRGVIRYTRSQWGEAQVRRYVASLERCMAGVAAGEGAWRSLADIHPGLRVVHCQHHYIFCLPREGEFALIVAVLHERMDLMARLANRLNK